VLTIGFSANFLKRLARPKRGKFEVPNEKITITTEWLNMPLVIAANMRR
jgi:hypothetical protein